MRSLTVELKAASGLHLPIISFIFHECFQIGDNIIAYVYVICKLRFFSDKY